MFVCVCFPSASVTQRARSHIITMSSSSVLRFLSSWPKQYSVHTHHSLASMNSECAKCVYALWLSTAIYLGAATQNHTYVCIHRAGRSSFIYYCTQIDQIEKSVRRTVMQNAVEMRTQTHMLNKWPCTRGPFVMLLSEEN